MSRSQRGESAVHWAVGGGRGTLCAVCTCRNCSAAIFSTKRRGSYTVVRPSSIELVSRDRFEDAHLRGTSGNRPWREIDGERDGCTAIDRPQLSAREISCGCLGPLLLAVPHLQLLVVLEEVLDFFPKMHSVR